MPKAFSDHERKTIQALLLEEGKKAFATFGFFKTSVDMLAASAGISKGAFYLFYASKEALFMDIVEQIEDEFRQSTLSTLAQSHGTPAERLAGVFKHAFSTWKSMPILQMIRQAEYAALLRRMPHEKLMEHLESDQRFITTLIDAANQAGIPMRRNPQEVAGLMNALFFVSLHETDFGEQTYQGTMDLLISLVANHCIHHEIPPPQA